MARGSQHESDEVTWQTAGVRLGSVGLDLRSPADPGALVELLNARFRDDRTVQPRNGHSGVLLRDNDELAAVGDGVEITDNWVYGHGATISDTNAAGWENAHLPFPRKGKATFRFADSDVVWTGDRLLVVDPDGGAALGSSTFWHQSTPNDDLVHRGIPAYLPLLTDAYPPSTVSGSYVETCLTERYRVFVFTESLGEENVKLHAWIINRFTGAVVDRSEISGVSNDPVEPRVFESAGLLVVVWRDATTKILYRRHWTGTLWADESEIHIDVYAFDLVPVDGGFHLLWREGSPSSDGLFVGKFSGITAQNQPYSFRTEVETSETPDGPVALDVSPAGDIGVVYQGNGLHARALSSTASTMTGADWLTLSGLTGWNGGVSIRSRGLRGANGRYEWVVHASRGDSAGVIIRSFTTDPDDGTVGDTCDVVRYNSRLGSKSFRVGDEVFCWLRSANAGTHYLVGGVYQPQVSGYADREEATARVTSEGNYAIPLVLPDPLNELTYTWIRPFNTGQTYARGGNVRSGDLDFLPSFTAVQFGQSVYLSGSAVRNYDGVELGDAGFQDYPVISSAVVGTSDGYMIDGNYYFRVYPVRYNRRGERFQGAAVTYGPVEIDTSGGVLNKITLTIATLPDTNHDDVQFEVYRTESGGTTFYLDGVVANDLTTATVEYTTTRIDTSTPPVDTDLIRQRADSHAPGLGAQAELEEWGPLGCSMLAVSGDRLWGAGGQVPAGVVQYSKLHEDGEGAGFDDLAGFQTVDTEGNAVTSVARMNDFTVVFEADQLFVITGAGPDNYGRGQFGQIITLADGATTHAGTVLTPAGLVFWGAKGPRLLGTGLEGVRDISIPVHALTEGMDPTGVRLDVTRHEVIWYTADGDALLWNYLADSRWARWNGLHVAGCSDAALVTTDGFLLIEDPDEYTDNGAAITFKWRTGNLRAEQILQGSTLLRAVGVVGEFVGSHELRVRIYFNGSPLWTDEWTWEPDNLTWLDTVTANGSLTPAEVDALGATDHSGAYRTHKRVSRHECSYFQVEVSNIEATGPSYIPTELSVELGSRGGLSRVPVNTFT